MSAIAVCVLTRGYANVERYSALIKRNQSIEKHLHGADMLIFHEGNIPLEHQQYIARATPHLQLQFINVGAEFQPSLIKTTSAQCKATLMSRFFPAGYKHMCRFWLRRFLDYTKAYKYVVRIDEDCVVHAFPPLPQLVAEMEANRIVYATPMFQGADTAGVVDGLRDFAVQFAQHHQLPCALDQIDQRNPYTNVFVLNAEYFRNLPIFNEFCAAVEETGCIYVNRWGDLPLWGIVLSCLLPAPYKSYEDKRIAYAHGSHLSYVVNGSWGAQLAAWRDLALDYWWVLALVLAATVAVLAWKLGKT